MARELLTVARMRQVYLLMMALACGCGTSPPAPGVDSGAPPDLSCPDGTHQQNGACAATLSWAKSGLVSPSRDHHGTFIVESQAGAFLYVIGGTDHFTANLYDDVERAPIAADGSLGALAQVGKLPHKLASMGMVVVGDLVVIAGGVKSSGGGFALAAESYVARVAPDGMLGAWSAGPPIPSAREHTSLVARERTVYLVGGLVGSRGTADVERATLAADGTLGAWSPLAALPQERSHHAAVLAQGAIYVAGGLHGDPTSSAVSYNDVLRAALRDDGSLDAWTTAATLPAALATHSASYFGGALYLFGGLEDDGSFVATVRSAALAPDGTLGAWTVGTPLPSARGHVLETPIRGRTVYSAGGYDNNGLTLTELVAGSFH